MVEDTAEILEDAEIVMVPKDEFIILVYSNLNIAVNFIKIIAQNIKEKEERLLNLAYGFLKRRVAKALIDIHSKFNINNQKSSIIDISREDIAQYRGAATEP